MPDQPTAQELIRALLALGWSKRGIARALGRNPRLIGYVAAGERPGHNLVQALGELTHSGQVTHPPARRQRADGQPVKVRGRGGALVTPPTPQPRRPRPRRPQSQQPPPQQPPPQTHQQRQPAFGSAPPIQPGPNRFHVTSHTTPGSTKEHHEVSVPRSDRSWNRWQGSDVLKGFLERAKINHRRFHAFATVEVGPPGHRQRMHVKLGGKGGYDPTTALAGIDREGTIWDWLRTQIEGRYDLDPDGDWAVVGLDLDIW